MSENTPFRMKFEMSTIKHLGLQMYSTLPPVIGELVANAWDANATTVTISIPQTPLDAQSRIIIEDDGLGMSDSDISQKYLIVGRDRRDAEHGDRTPKPFTRRIMGRKGIGKFSAFGIAREIEIESVCNGTTSRFIMNYDEMLEDAEKREAEFDRLPPTQSLRAGTRVTMRKFTKFRTRGILLKPLRRRLARRFSVMEPKENFQVVVNGSKISVEERDLIRLLERDVTGQPYLWRFDEEEIAAGTGLTVSGWIGSVKRTTPDADGIDRGVSILARGKMVQEPFEFQAGVGQQFAMSYLVGEIHAEFVDEGEDTIGTSRNTLVWDAEANALLLAWGKKKMARIARAWSDRRSADNRHRVERHGAYLDFKARAMDSGNRRAIRLADQLLRQAITKNPTAGPEEFEPVIRTCTDFLEYNAFWEITKDLVESDAHDIEKLVTLFREWEVVEAKEMARVTEGRVETIKRLQRLIEEDALEKPTLHNFLKQFPWVIDPRWTLVADEVRYTDLLRRTYPESTEVPERDRRIDFLCVREGSSLVVVEIKRPGSKASLRELGQIESYILFARDRVERATEKEWGSLDVVGYLLCGDVVDDGEVRQKMRILEAGRIYVRTYDDLLTAVKRLHLEFLERYEQLKAVRRPS